MTQKLSVLFGQVSDELSTLSTKDFADDAKLLPVLLGDSTCALCYGEHRAEDCPIVTRDFTKAIGCLRLSSAQKRELAFTDLQKSIGERPLETHSDTQALNASFQQFVQSSQREAFAAEQHKAVNLLASLLCKAGSIRRAALVLSHIPQHLRLNEVYRALAVQFGAEPEDYLPLLEKRHVGVLDDSHPTLPQVLRVCCICFNEAHASHQCPRFEKWREIAVLPRPKASEKEKGSKHKGSLGLCESHADGWLASGQERLLAFSLFLQHALESVNSAALKDGEVSALEYINRNLPLECPLTDTVKRCIRKLASVGDTSHALRLFALCPATIIQEDTWKSVAILLQAPSAGSSADSVTAALETPDLCLWCFAKGHSFKDCRERPRHGDLRQQIAQLCHSLSVLQRPRKAVLSATETVAYMMERDSLSVTQPTDSSSLHGAVWQLASVCFMNDVTPARGHRLLRRFLPLAVPDKLHMQFWSCAGLSKAETVDRLAKLLEWKEAQRSLFPSQKAKQLNADQLRQYYQIVDGGLCHRCFLSGHILSECPSLRTEIALGQDMLSTFRCVVASGGFDPSECRGLVFSMVHWLLVHHQLLPFDILSIQRCANALCAVVALIGEGGVALRVLLAIPPAYRMRHAFSLTLQALGVSKTVADERLAGFVTWTENTEGRSEFIINRRSPIPDVAMADVVEPLVSDVAKALKNSDRIVLTASSIATKESVCCEEISAATYSDVNLMRQKFLDAVQSRVEKRLGIALGSRHAASTPVPTSISPPSSSAIPSEKDVRA